MKCTTVIRFFWFEGDEIHFDAELYARVRGITVDEAVKELTKLCSAAVPGAKLKVVE